MLIYVRVMIQQIFVGIIVLVIFAIVFKYYVLDYLLIPKHYDNEGFTDVNDDDVIKPVNTRISYYNIGEYPWNRHTIISSIPYDIKSKEDAPNAPYFEMDNETYNQKLKDVFQSSNEQLIVALEGSKWSNWINPRSIENKQVLDRLNKYYSTITGVINEHLNRMPTDGVNKKIQVVHDLMRKYKYNKSNNDYYLFDIEMIFYREGKIQGKHIKCYAITNGKEVYIIVIKIIGVISEDNIMLFPYVANDTLNSLEFDIFIPEQQMDDVRKKADIDSTNDAIVKRELENILYQKLIDNYNYEETDISNNSYNQEKETLFRSNFGALQNNFMEGK